MALPLLCYNTLEAVSRMMEQRNKGNILMTLWNAAGIIIIVGFFVFSPILLSHFTDDTAETQGGRV